MTIYADVQTAQLTTSDGASCALDEERPRFYYGTEKELIIVLKNGGEAYPVSSTDSFTLALDADTNHSNELMAFDDACTIVSGSEGKISAKLNCLTAGFLEKIQSVAAGSSLTVYLELARYAQGHTTPEILLQDHVQAYPRIQTGENAPPGASSLYYTSEEIDEMLEEMELTGGDGIQISGGTISATGNSAGSGIQISGNTISADYSTVQQKLTGGDGIQISGTTISADYSTVQQKLTGGDGIQISGNTISCSAYTAGKNITISNGTIAAREQIIFLSSVSETAPEECTAGDRYYNTGTGKIYTATGTNVWGTNEETPAEETLYLDQTSHGLYQWNGSILSPVSEVYVYGYVYDKKSNPTVQKVIFSRGVLQPVSEFPEMPVHDAIRQCVMDDVNNRHIAYYLDAEDEELPAREDAEAVSRDISINTAAGGTFVNPYRVSKSYFNQAIEKTGDVEGCLVIDNINGRQLIPVSNIVPDGTGTLYRFTIPSGTQARYNYRGTSSRLYYYPHRVDLSGGDGDVMTEYPIFHYLGKENKDGKRMELISMEAFPGSKIHPACYIGRGASWTGSGTPFDVTFTSTPRKQYTGSYEATLADSSGNVYSDMLTETTAAPHAYSAGDKMRSVKGAKPWTNATLSEFEAGAAANGGHAENWLMPCVRALLHTIEYGTLDSQSEHPGFCNAAEYQYAYTRVSGRGNFGAGSGNTISANESGIVWAIGTSDAEKVIESVYRGCHNPWGAVWKMQQGIQLYNDGTTSGYRWSVNTEHYTATDQHGATGTDAVYVWNAHEFPASGFVSSVTRGDMMARQTGGSSATYYCDYFSHATGEGSKIMRSGGCMNDGVNAGAFAVNTDGNCGLTGKGLHVSCRLSC